MSDDDSDFGLSRTLPESCNGKGSGNSKQMKDSIIKYSLKDEFCKESLNDWMLEK